MVMHMQVLANTGASGSVIDRAAKAQKVTGNRLASGNVAARRVVSAAYNESRMPYTAAGVLSILSIYTSVQPRTLKCLIT